eukprot:COSAG01_NODE_2106_length_8416_cov_47.839485_18_plen_116_part_00
MWDGASQNGAGAGEDHGIDHGKTWLRFPYDSTFLRSHYLQPHPSTPRAVRSPLHPPAVPPQAGRQAGPREQRDERSVARAPGTKVVAAAEGTCPGVSILSFAIRTGVTSVNLSQN